MMDTPYHIGYLKMNENDSRRDKRRCIYFERNDISDSYCKKSLVKCISSSHCQYYNENIEDIDKISKTDELIRELEAINKHKKYQQELNQKRSQKIKELDSKTKYLKGRKLISEESIQCNDAIKKMSNFTVNQSNNIANSKRPELEDHIKINPNMKRYEDNDTLIVDLDIKDMNIGKSKDECNKIEIIKNKQSSIKKIKYEENDTKKIRKEKNSIKRIEYIESFEINVISNDIYFELMTKYFFKNKIKYENIAVCNKFTGEFITSINCIITSKKSKIKLISESDYKKFINNKNLEKLNIVFNIQDDNYKSEFIKFMKSLK